MNTAYCIDCMEYMRDIPDKYFDLAVVDPPYGDAGGGTHFTRGIRKSSPNYQSRLGQVRIIAWDVAPEKEYFDELFRVSRNQIIWGGNYFALPPSRCFLIWRKTNVPLEGFSMSPCEYAWTSFNENCRVFEHTSIRDATSGKFHPTEKPIALYEWILKHYADPGNKILDTHLGSGSSRIAAYNLGFDFVGCEKNKYYFDKQEERFAAHAAQTSLFVDGG